MAEVKSMIDKESESAWLEEVTHRYKDATWSRKMTRESFGTVSIYRIPSYLRELHAKSYIPRVVTLGLFHHQPTNPLSEMDRRKVDAVLRMRDRLPSEKQNSLVDVLKDSVSQITRCYEDETDTDDDTIVWTCLLDGCFILEILRVLTRQQEEKNPREPPSSGPNVEENSDPIYNRNRVKSCQFDILGDFFMMENQLPIVVLVKLLQLEMDGPRSAEKELYRMVCEIACIIHPFLPKGFPQNEKPEWRDEKDGDLEKYKHMLGLFQSFVSEEYLAPRPEAIPQQAVEKDSSHYCLVIKKCMCRDGEQERQQQQQQQQQEEGPQRPDDKRLDTVIKASASELYNSGMKFKPYYGVPSKKKLLFDRNKRTLSLPAVFITDSSEMIFRNLMAMEVCRPESVKKVSYYVLLMNTLVEGEGDVAVLRRAGVIQSSMGTDDEVTDLFNGLCKGLNLQDVEEDPFVQVKIGLNDWYKNRSMVQIKQFLQSHPRLMKNFAMFWALVLVIASAVPTLFPIFKKFIQSQSGS